MSDFTDYIARADTDANATVPVELVNQLVTGMAKSSAALALGHSMPMSAFVNIIPSEATLPVAYWNVPDAQPTALLQTSKMAVALNTETAYEMGTLIPVFQNELDDSQLPMWDMIKPRVAEALAVLLDNASIWGVNMPPGANPSVMDTIATNSGGRLAHNAGVTSSSAVVTDTAASSADVGKHVYGTGIPSGATVASVSAGVSMTLSATATASATENLLILPASPAYITQATDLFTGGDSAKYVLQAAQNVAQGSFSPTAAWVAPGWQYRNMAARTQALVANPVGNDAVPLLLGGLPIAPFAGAGRGSGQPGVGPIWNAFADAIVGDWSALKIGVRQDITMDMHPDGVISNASGVVTFNAMQARGVVLRASARYSWAVIPPLVADTSFVGTRSCFASVMNSGTAGPVGATDLTDTRPQIPITIPVDSGGDGTARPRSGKQR